MISARRCLLFVPGSRPERFTKAVATAADMVCVDLEDAVGVEDKIKARAHALSFASEYLVQSDATVRSELVVRINSLRTANGLSDLLAISAWHAVHPKCALKVMLPKVCAATEIEIAHGVLNQSALEPALQVFALIESALGIEQAFTIAAAPGLSALMLGGADLMAELGGAMSSASLLYARSRLAAAAASRGLLAIDAPFFDVGDRAGLAAETAAVSALGFACKSAIHPVQVDIIQSTLMPTDEEVLKAKRILSAFAASPHAAVLIDHKLVERPVLLSAQRTVVRAGGDIKLL